MQYNEELAAKDEIEEIAFTIDQSEREQKEQYMQIIWTLLNLLEIKDEYTAGHSRAVTIYAEQIAEFLKEEYHYDVDSNKIRVAATLHDIGKIGIDGKILNKPSRLTEEEYAIIKTHAEKGAHALREIDSLKEEIAMIKHHHERYDGSGYPEGRRGEEIPIGARIICIADSFDAMTSDRPYKKGMPLPNAIEELTRNKGTQFDPFIVDAFVKVLARSSGHQCGYI